MTSLIEDVCRVAREAGALIERVRAQGAGATLKNDRSLVTRADREADAYLRQALRALHPAAWLSEETADDHARLSAPAVWIVDPLDGTREFVEGLPEYAVAIGLVENARPVLGVVLNPATGELFHAARGQGAFLDGKPLQVAEGRTLLASRSETKGGEFAPFERDWDVEAVGSIQLKLALVAAGRAAATLSRGPKHEWDVCAGAVIVAEAGGLVTDTTGGALPFNQPFPKVRGVVAGAPRAHARALGQVLATGPSARMRELGEPLPPA
jgi:myo-inositol-1(or 4)-monophosphatase